MPSPRRPARPQPAPRKSRTPRAGARKVAHRTSPSPRGGSVVSLKGRRYDRAAAEHYWGDERRRLGDEFRIVLSAGERPFVNQAYHVWEVMTLVRGIKPTPRQRVLDVACGLGRVSGPLAASGVRTVGIDNAYAMARQAARKTVRIAREERVKVRADYLQGFSGSLPFADDSFDGVLCLGLLEHLPGWLQQRTLEECLRVLKRRGALYLVLNNNRSLLLSAGQDNRYRKARQLPNGYYCGLVDRHKLVSGLARRGHHVEVLGSNGHYAVLRHALRGRDLTPAEAREAERAFVAATDRDLAEPNQGEFGETCADHFFYRIVRR